MAKKKKPAVKPTGAVQKPAAEASDPQPKPAAKKQIEAYTHGDKRRVNNPPVGLVTPHSDPADLRKKTYEYDPHLDPQLVWAGKAEHSRFEVPTVSLHVHERIDPKTIIAAVRTNGERAKPGSIRPRQMSLFEEPKENPPLRDALDFYKHPHGWTNRFVAGDSLLVMNSLLEKEGLAGKIQMIYIDPPYGIRYGSNFQPFTNRRDVKDGKDEDLTQEPETLKAFRDTWEIGIHSYLTHLRDRLLLSRELLHESGSVFVQISDENLHVVRILLDEVFGRENFRSLIQYRTSVPLSSVGLAGVTDYIMWYARDNSVAKFRDLFIPRETGDKSRYTNVELPSGERRTLSAEEKADATRIPRGSRIYSAENLASSGYTASCTFDFNYRGKTYRTSSGKSWKTTRDGMDRLGVANRITDSGATARYVLFMDDYPVMKLTNLWGDTTGEQEKQYAVQTHVRVIARCLLMTTDPGDLVFDPTCGSGTSAFVAEQWGRRWITCDTSRVAITLAKQRLMTAVYDYYSLAQPSEGISSGFKYKTVPHVTLKSIANNPEIKAGLTRKQIDATIARHAEQEALYDQPEIDRTKARVTGPFTVEAVPAINVRPIETVTESHSLDLDSQTRLTGLDDIDTQRTLTADTSVARYGETSRQTEWRDELARTGVRAKGGQKIEFARLEPMPGCRYLHAIGETKGGGQKSEVGGQKTVVVSFGPEHAPLEQRQVTQALDDAEHLRPKPHLVLFAAFHFDPEAAKDIDETKWPGVELLKLQMNTDLLTDDLKKKRASNESFWLIGQPDVELRQIKQGEHKGLWRVEVRGFDYYSPANGQIESGDTSKIAMWLLDTDYDGRSLFPRQVFFPMSGEKDGWSRLSKNLKAEIDEELIEAYRGVQSLPFEAGQFKRVAVKIVDDRGIESLKILAVE
jgi:adenine-specific DNA-methyltransferase